MVIKHATKKCKGLNFGTFAVVIEEQNIKKIRFISSTKASIFFRELIQKLVKSKLPTEEFEIIYNQINSYNKRKFFS